MHSQNASPTSPSRANYGVSVVRIWGQMYRVIMTSHCIELFRVDSNPGTRFLPYRRMRVDEAVGMVITLYGLQMPERFITCQRNMMTSWHGHTRYITGPLWGDSISGFPIQKACNTELDAFFADCSRMLSEQAVEWAAHHMPDPDYSSEIILLLCLLVPWLLLPPHHQAHEIGLIQMKHIVVYVYILYNIGWLTV